ncbi:MAG: Uma2 family endonuclease [Candidatus Eremiobacterota bacterium]
MADALKEKKRIYTFADYMTLPDDELWEILDGVPYNMAPPSLNHERVSGELYYFFKHYLRGKTCEVFSAPFGVRFPKEDEPDEYVKDALMPDITVVCDKKKLDDRGCRGAPDLIVEILSPSTAKRDIKSKRQLYQNSGVKEYWIVDPLHKTLQVYKLDDQGKYGFPETYGEDDKIKVGIFNNELEIDLTTVFAY